MEQDTFVQATHSQAHAEREKLAQAVAELAPWFHNLHLNHSVQTMPDHPLGDFPASKWAQIAPRASG